MSYTEPLQQTLHNTGINYGDAAADVVATEVGGMPIQIHALGAVVTTAFVTSTSLKFGLDITDKDRVTESTSELTCSIPNGAAVGAIIITRATAEGLVVDPGGFFTITIATQGVGSAGIAKPFVLWRYSPRGDLSNVTAVTA